MRNVVPELRRQPIGAAADDEQGEAIAGKISDGYRPT